MADEPQTKPSVVKQIADGEVKGAPRALLEDLFEDYYKNRHRIYTMNLVRGIFFGFGGVIGGTLVVALLLWILSIFHYIPFLSDIVDAVKSTIEAGKR